MQSSDWFAVPEGASNAFVCQPPPNEPGILTVPVGDSVQVIAIHARGFALVRSKGRVGIVPTTTICQISPLQTPTATRSGLPRSSVIQLVSDGVATRTERADVAWRRDLRDLLLDQNVSRARSLMHQTSQLAAWLTAKDSNSGDFTKEQVINDSLLHLIDAANQRADRAIVPKGIDDEPQTIHNTAIMDLFTAHRCTAQRVEEGLTAPRSATESLSLDVSKNLHGGPFISNDRAANLSSSNFNSKEDGKQTHLTQVLVDFDVIRAMQAIRQPAEIFVSVFDATNQIFTSHEASVSVDATGLPIKTGAKGKPPHRVSDAGTPVVAAGLSDSWCQAFFVNVPTQLIRSGAAYLVFRVYRKGPLTESAANAAAISTVAAGRDGETPTASPAESSVTSPGIMGFFGRKRQDTAIYNRPAGVGVHWLPSSLSSFTDGTPHKGDSVTFYRPPKHEEGKFASLHVTLIEDHRKSNRTRSDSRIEHAKLDDAESKNESEDAGEALDARKAALLVRATRLEPLPVVCRAFSGLANDVLRNPRYWHLLSNKVRHGSLVLPNRFHWSATLDDAAGTFVPLSIPALLSTTTPSGLEVTRSFPKFRSDFAITIRKGTFSQDTKLAARNIQVRVHVLNEEGEVIPCIFRGFPVDNGPPSEPHLLHEYRSSVYYHNNSPLFDETLVLRMPSNKQLAACHLRFSFWHASTNETKTSLFSFTFLSLTNRAGVPIRDGVHTLRCFKPVADMDKASIPSWYVSAPFPEASNPYQPTEDRGLPISALPISLVAQAVAAKSSDWGGKKDGKSGKSATSEGVVASKQLEFRNDIFEVDVALLSDLRTHVTEIHKLRNWRSLHHEELRGCLVALKFVVRNPTMFVKHFTIIMLALLEIVGSEGETLPAETSNAAMVLLVSLLNNNFSTFPGVGIEPVEFFAHLLGPKNLPPILTTNTALSSALSPVHLLDAFLQSALPMPECHMQIFRFVLQCVKQLINITNDGDYRPGTDMETCICTIEILCRIAMRSLVDFVAKHGDSDVFGARNELINMLSACIALLKVSTGHQTYSIACAILRQCVGVCQCVAKLTHSDELFAWLEDILLVSHPTSAAKSGVDFRRFRLDLAKVVMIDALLSNNAVLHLFSDAQRARLLTLSVAFVAMALNQSASLRVLLISLLPQLTSACLQPGLTSIRVFPMCGLLGELCRCICILSDNLHFDTETAQETSTTTQISLLAFAQRQHTISEKASGAEVDAVMDSVGDSPCDSIPSECLQRCIQQLRDKQNDTPRTLQMNALRIAATTLFAIINSTQDDTMEYIFRNNAAYPTLFITAERTFSNDSTHTSHEHKHPEHTIASDACKLSLCVDLLRSACWLLQLQPIPTTWTSFLHVQGECIFRAWIWVAAFLVKGYASCVDENSPLSAAALSCWQLFFEVGIAMLTKAAAEDSYRYHSTSCDNNNVIIRTISAMRVVWGGILAQECDVAKVPKSLPHTSGLGTQTKLALSTCLVPYLLDITYSRNADLNVWARDTYLDLVAAELTFRYTETATSVADSNKATLPLIERLTIDAIDVLVKRKSPAFVHCSSIESDSLASEGFILALLSKPSDAPSAASGSQSAAITPQANMNVSTSDTNLRSPAFSLTRRLGNRDLATPSKPAEMPIPAAFQELLAHPYILRFFDEIRTLYKMLQSVSRYPATAMYEDERTEGALTLIAYLRRTHRLDIYVKYVSFLHDMHCSLGNSAEAALTYLLYADIYDWSDEMVPPVYANDQCILPASTSAYRKELVLSRAVRDLVAAQCWEMALNVLETLIQRYSSQTFEYTKLSKLQHIKSQLVYKVAHSKRVFPSYFLVHYVRGAYPAAIRGKLFVYRGGPGERLGSFEPRIQEKWPDCKRLPLKLHLSMLTKPQQDGGEASSAGFEIAFAGAAVILFIPQHPLFDSTPINVTGTGLLHADMSHDSTTTEPAMPSAISAGQLNAQVLFFVFPRPFRRRAERSENEFMDTWISRMYVATKEAFPGTRRRSEVVFMHEVVLNPLEVAILQLQEKNDALRTITETAAAGPDRSAEQEFSQLLSGVVDAAVSGGVANFKGYLNGDFEHSHPEILADIRADARKEHLVKRLKDTLLQQCILVARGIRVHAAKCQENMLPLHDFLKVRYNSMITLMRDFGVIDNPTPTSS